MIIADTWYAERLHSAIRLEDLVAERFRPLIGRSGLARGIAMVILGIGADAVVTTNAAPGALVCKIAYGLLGVRKLVLLEYIVHEAERQDYLRRIWFRFSREWLVRRALLRAQVLTEHEAKTLPAEHRLAACHFVLVKWPSRFDDSPAGDLNNTRRVVATGRRTDWKTFFAAAEGTEWEVRAVCTGSDLAEVKQLAAPNFVVRHDISAAEHQVEVERATVYVIPVLETGASIGQVRVMNATQAGVPIVASNVIGLQGYIDQSCAVMVPPGDHVALRESINELLRDPHRREQLRDTARQRGGTMSEYLEHINELVGAAVAARLQGRTQPG